MVASSMSRGDQTIPEPLKLQPVSGARRGGHAGRGDQTIPEPLKRWARDVAGGEADGRGDQTIPEPLKHGAASDLDTD